MKRAMGAISLLLVSTAFVGMYSQPTVAEDMDVTETSVSDDESYFKDLDDRYSYAYGAELAKKFKAEGIELDVEMLAAGMRDAFGEGDMKMPEGEQVATIQIYQEIHNKRKEAERAAVAQKNKQEGEAFLVENARNEDVVVTDSGLQYRIITEGNGDYTPTAEDEVTVHYRGSYVDGTEFDSTYERNEPYTVKVKRLIEGWSEALQMMSEGAKWELYIPSEIAYGEEGSGNYVGPNAVLVFEVELLNVNKTKDS